MAFGDADRAVFTSDFGSGVVVGAEVARGTLRHLLLEEQDGAGYAVKVQRPTLLVSRDSFTRPSPDDVVTVGGVAYRFRGVIAVTPGAVSVDEGMETWVLAEVST